MESIAQCSISEQVAIVDKDTTIVNFLIEGAEVDDLGINGVCGLNIDFTHDYLGDVTIILISPAGQEVLLVGPSLQTSPNTQFVRWNVNFIPCGFPPSPDPGILPAWFNVNNWFQFTTYTGSYYPFLGCLEDLNTGPVNGSWSIKIIDAVDFGSGIIEDLSIVFCDPSGIDCASCAADAGLFIETELSYCEGQEELLIFPEVGYMTLPPDTVDYIYKYAIFNGNASYITDTVDLRFSSPGTNEVCGLSINADQEFTIPSISGILDKSTYQDLLQSTLSCAALTSECITINIQDVQDTIMIIESICSGDSITVDGRTFYDPGTFIVSYDGPMCNSMTILELEVFTLESVITGQQDSLTCTGNSVFLDGSNSTGDDTVTYRWFTNEGLIRTDSTLSNILVSQVGEYWLEVTSGFCKDTASVFIAADDSFIELDFEYNTLDCNNQSTLIDMTSSQPLTDVRWDGPTAFSRVGDDIVVSEAGFYYITVTSVDGCTSQDSIEIIDGFDVEDPVLDIPQITCAQPIVTPGVSFADTSILSYDWTGPGGFNTSERSPQIDTPGAYVLNVMSTNGCTETWNIVIEDIRDYPSLTTFYDTLDCANQTIQIGVNSSLPNVTYTWNGPSGFTSDQSGPVIDLEGMYTVTVTTVAQCTASAFVPVEKDVRLPSLNLTDVTINCNDNGVVSLNASSDANNPMYSWSGPSDYDEVGPSPTASIIGTYSVTVQGSNGCERTRSLSLVPGADVPDISFSSDTINCDFPMRNIQPSDTAFLLFEYTSEAGTVFEDTNPLTSEGGEYSITVTDTLGCFADYIHDVDIDTATPMLATSALQIDCNNDSVMIRLINDIPLREIGWTGPAGYVSSERMPYVDNPGNYIVNVVGTNGCPKTDSIMVIENFDMPQITPFDYNFTCVAEEIDIGVGVDVFPSTFEWSGPGNFTSTDARPTVTVNGDYYVTVTGPNGCINNDSLRVDHDTIVPVVTLAEDGPLTCPDPVVTLTGTSSESDVQIFWIGPDTVFSDGLVTDIITPGLWTMEVIDTAGCIGRTDINVSTEIDYPDILVSYNDIDCNLIFSHIEVDAGPLTEMLVWQGPDAIADNTLDFNTDVEGEYMILASGINGCDTTVSFTILKDTIPPDFSLTAEDTLTCGLTTVTIDVIDNGMTSIAEYNWIGPGGFTSASAIPDITESGRYILQAAGSNGCISIDTIQVAIDTIAPFVEGIGNVLTCLASKARLDVLTNVNDPEYLWTGPNDFQSVQKNPLAVAPGLYVIEVKGSNGCVASDEIELLEDKQAPRIIIDETSYLFCDSSGINLEVSSDILETTFIWFGDNFFSVEQRPFIDTTGVYHVFATGPNGCRSQDSTIVVIDTRLPDYEVEKSNIDCVEDLGMITTHDLEDDMTWEWTGPGGFTSTETSFAVSDSGDYTLIVQGTNLCTDTFTVNVAIDKVVPIPVAFYDEILQCEVMAIHLDGSQSLGAHNLSYDWSTDDGDIIENGDTPFPLVGKEGTYTLTVIDQINKCQADTSIFVERTEQEFLDFLASTIDPSCIGFQNGEIIFEDMIGGYGPIAFSFNGSPFTFKTAFRFLDAGTYTITAKDSLGCQVTKEFTLIPPRDITIDLGDDRLIEFGETTELFVDTNVPEDSIRQLIWSDTSGLECIDCVRQTIKPLKTVTYRVTIQDINGCENDDEVTIRVSENFVIDFPNVIKMGSDSGNDRFYVAQTQGIEKINFLSIYDRWGDRMFHAENFLPGDSAIGWDGMFLGQPALPAVYVVISEVILENGDIVLLESDLTLIR